MQPNTPIARQVSIDIIRMDHFLKPLLFSSTPQSEQTSIVGTLQFYVKCCTHLQEQLNQIKSDLASNEYSKLSSIVSDLLRITTDKVNKQLSEDERKERLASASSASNSSTLLHFTSHVKVAGGSGGGNGNRSESDDSAQRVQSLMLEQKNIADVEVQNEVRYHEALTLELAEMTSVLKESTLAMSETLGIQNKALSDIQFHAADNFDEISKQKKKMGVSTSQVSSEVWSSVGSILWVVAVFIIAYLVIRLFPKPVNS